MHIRIGARLYMLIGLFAVGCAILGGTLTMLQSNNMYSARQNSLEDLTDVAIGVLDAHKKLADQGLLNEEDAKARALAVIASMRYRATDYFFARDLSGTTIMHPISAQSVGKRTDDTPDVKGKYFSREMTAIGNSAAGKGFVEYTYAKPKTGVETDKLTFVKVYRPWGIVIGTGVYIDDLQAAQRELMWQAALVTLLLVVTLGMITFVVAKGIGGPLRRLAKSMHDVIAGRHASVDKEATRQDEIGEMARAVALFQKGTEAKERAEHEAAEHRKRAEDERMTREAEKTAEAHNAQLTISALGEGLTRLAQGDLQCRIETPFEDKAEKLRHDFNAAVEKLKQTMLAVVASTQAITAGSYEITTGADDLSRRTEQQAATIEETAAALDQITATIKKAADGAGHAREVVATAKIDAETGGTVVRRAVEAMSGIEKSSQQIGQIIGVIDEIAFQTNLLALNAGVEAARAGEAGRGFAVVASEVRALAQRSAGAAKEIKSIISASAAQVADGVQLVGQTGASLERIMAQVNDLNSVMAELAVGAQEQATSLTQVNTAINDMDGVTQQNAAMVEQSTAASHTLQQEAGNLSSLIGQFKVGDTQVLPARGATAPAPARRPAPGRPHAVGAAKASVVKMARKPASSAQASEEWQDF